MKYKAVIEVGPITGKKGEVLREMRAILKDSFPYKSKILEAFPVSTQHPKQIGSAFERNFCRELSLWVSGGKRDDIFYRTRGSGSRATMRRVGLHQGDVCALREEGFPLIDRVIFELKSYTKLPLFSFFSSCSGEIGQWWKKLARLSNKYEKIPWLVLRSRSEKHILNIFPSEIELAEDIKKLKNRHVCGVFLDDLFNLGVGGFLECLDRLRNK